MGNVFKLNNINQYFSRVVSTLPEVSEVDPESVDQFYEWWTILVKTTSFKTSIYKYEIDVTQTSFFGGLLILYEISFFFFFWPATLNRNPNFINPPPKKKKLGILRSC